jgi:hypothetical protein
MGLQLIDRIYPIHLDHEREMISALSESEQEALIDLLRKLLISFEGEKQPLKP